VIERDYLKHLSEEFREAHLTNCFGERLFMKKSSGATICPCDCFVSCNCWCWCSQAIGTNQQYVGLIADLKLMRALKVIGNETHDREHGYSLDVP
jgi:hypothetical protein